MSRHVPGALRPHNHRMEGENPMSESTERPEDPAVSTENETCEYYLAQDGAIYGPIELQTLAAWIGERRVKPRDWVFVPGVFDWVPILELPDMAGCFYNVIDKPQTPPPGLPVDTYVKYYRVQQERAKDPLTREIEKRQWLRLPVSTSMSFREVRDISAEATRTYQTYTRNISEGGMAFEWGATLEVGANIDVEIDFYPTIVQAQARVAHCRLLEKGEYLIGAAFKNPPDAERDKIRRFIRGALHTAARTAPAAS